MAKPVSLLQWLVGHAKGGAAAWALNGLIQSTLTATVPGNRNADDIAPELRKFTYLLYASKTLQRTPEDHNAGLVTSFGFGQVGGIAAILHPGHLFARLPEQDFKEYAARRVPREGKTHARMHAMFTSNSLVRVKDAPPYSDVLQDEVMINIHARASPVGDSYAFVAPLATAPPAGKPQQTAAPAAKSSPNDDLAQGALSALAGSIGQVQGVGIDAQQVSAFPADEAFLRRK